MNIIAYPLHNNQRYVMYYTEEIVFFTDQEGNTVFTILDHEMELIDNSWWYGQFNTKTNNRTQAEIEVFRHEV